jgi:CHAT domain-containing protein
MNNSLLISRAIYRPFEGRAFVPLLRLPFLLSLLFVSSATSFSQTLPQNNNCTDVQNNPEPLASGETLTRAMKANQRHIFRLALTPQQYAHVTVEQKGVDVVLRIFNPNMLQLIERDSPNGKFGPEAVSTVAQLDGTYYVEVCANKSQPVGSYELKLEGPRPSSAADEKRVRAESMVMEGQNLLRQETEDAPALAIKQFETAQQLFNELGNTLEEGYVLCNIGDTFRNSGNFSQAMSYFEQALARLAEAKDVSGQAYVLNQMGAAHRDLDAPSKALDKYARALELRVSIGDRWGEAQLHNNVAVIYTRIGEQQKSIASSDLALTLWRQLNDRGREMNTLNNIAKANLDLGNLSVAFQQLQDVISYCDQPDAQCSFESSARNNLSIIYDTWGDPNGALTQYNRALEIFRAKNDKANQVITLNNIGLVFAGVGEGPSALDAFQEALGISLQTLNRAGEGVTRSNLGYGHILMGNYTAALKELEQAQPLNHAAEDPRFEAYTLVRLGMAHVAMRAMDKAIVAYNQALEIQTRIEDNRGQAITLDKIGELYSLLNQPVLALKNYRQALERWRRLSDAQGEALSLYGIARVERNQNHLTEAQDRISDAIARVESLRTKMTSYRLRLSYYAAKQDFFELEIDIRMRLYYATRSTAELEAALFASERSRARSLLDLLAESHADIREDVRPELLQRERKQRDLLTDKWTQFQLLLSGKPTDAQRNAADKEIRELTHQLDKTEAEIRQSSQRYAALTQQPLEPAEVQKLLDDDTLLLQYALGQKQSYLWAITRTEILPYVLPGEAQITKAAQSFRTSLRAWEKRPTDDTPKYVARLNNAPANYRRQALNLSNIVLGPVLSKIGSKRLVVIADGELQYVPFGALLVRNAKRPLAPVPLIVNHEIVYQPSASALDLIRKARRTAATKTVAVLADPVFSKTDNRVVVGLKDSKTEPNIGASSRELKRALRDAGDIGSVDGSFRLERLEYSRNEADAIIAAAPPGSAMKALDFDASRAHVLGPELKQFKMVHLATHGILNGTHPELSGLVFSLVDEQGKSEDGFLKLSDIYNIDLPLDMIVLSACQSAIGKPVKGEGLVGLTRGFMHAGAARVVASLWNVQDEATADLMKRFYSYLLQNNMPAAAALRRAQLDLIETRGVMQPYYWAGFVLQGEWR